VRGAHNPVRGAHNNVHTPSLKARVCSDAARAPNRRDDWCCVLGCDPDGDGIEYPNPWGRFGMHDVHEVLSGSPFFPVQVAVALLLGWLLSDQFKHGSMLWVWVLPYAYLIFEFVRGPNVVGLSFQERFSHFFGSGCRPDDQCFDQTGITVTFYIAAAYAIGAFLERAFPLRSLAGRRKLTGLVLTIGVLILGEVLIDLIFDYRDLLRSTPLRWQWLLLPTAAFVAGIGAFLIVLALKMRRASRAEVSD